MGLEFFLSSSSLGSRCVPWLGEGLGISSPNDPVLCCPLPYRVAPVFVQVVLVGRGLPFLPRDSQGRLPVAWVKYDI